MIDIAVASCPDDFGTPSCQEWTIAPDLDAVPGLYEVTVEPANPNRQVNIQRETFNLNLPSSPTNTAPAALAVFGGHVRNREFQAFNVLTRDNRRWGWGGNLDGDIGVGSYYVEAIDRVQPLKVNIAALDRQSTARFVDLAVGDSRPSLGLTEAGDVLAWGGKSAGLGIVTQLSQAPISLPATVPDIQSARGIEVDAAVVPTYTGVPIDTACSSERDCGEFLIDAETFAIVASEVRFWGGRGGVLDAEPRFGTVYSRVGELAGEPLVGVVDVAAGGGFGIALKVDGTVWTWGSNQSGRLGREVEEDIQYLEETGANRSPVARQVPALANVRSIAAGFSRGVAISESGQLYWWGESHVQTASGITTTVTPVRLVADWGQGGRNGYQIFDVALYGDFRGMLIARQESTPEIDGEVWVWDINPSDSVRVPGVRAIDVDSGYAVGGECGEVVTSAGSTQNAGFVWDISEFPGEPPLILPVFGKEDSQCPHRLTVTTLGSGRVQFSGGSVVLPEECERDICMTTHEFEQPARVNLLAQPDAGWVLHPTQPWGGTDECRNAENRADVAVTVQGGTQCIAQFVPADGLVRISVTIVGNGRVTSGAGEIDCPGTCSVGFARFGNVQLSTQPDPGWRFDRWMGGCEQSFMADNNFDCTAVFVEDASSASYTLSVGVSGNGVVSSTPAGIDCPQTCDAPFAENEVVALQPIPATGWSFDGWSGDAACGDQVTMSADINCTANFTQSTGGGAMRTLTLTITGGPGAGEVRSNDGPPPTMDCINSATPETVCTATYADGTTVELIPSPFIAISDIVWTGCDQSAGIEGCSVTMNADRSVQASFVP